MSNPSIQKCGKFEWTFWGQKSGKNDIFDENDQNRPSVFATLFSTFFRKTGFFVTFFSKNATRKFRKPILGKKTAQNPDDF